MLKHSNEVMLLGVSSVSAAFFPHLESIGCLGQTMNGRFCVKEGRNKTAQSNSEQQEVLLLGKFLKIKKNLLNHFYWFMNLCTNVSSRGNTGR